MASNGSYSYTNGLVVRYVDYDDFAGSYQQLLGVDVRASIRKQDLYMSP